MMNKKKILIAEDDQFLAKMYKIQLGDERWDFRIASNGSEAIEHIDSSQPDLLFLDIMMPKNNGFDVLNHIKDKGYSFPVIVLSNLSIEEDQNRCLKLGANEYVIKSNATPEFMITLIEKYLG